MYSFDSVVRYSETDKDERLSLTSLVNYFQDCSSFSSEVLDVGFTELTEAHRAWILSSWQIVIKSFPKMSDKVRVSTWPYDFERFFGSRNFTMENEHGEIVACANSLWVFVDMETGRPIAPDKRFRDAYVLEEKYADMDYEGRKITVPKNMKQEECFRIRKCNLDTYNHVNNGQYIKLAEEYLPEGFVTGQIRAEYKTSAVYHDVICPYVQVEESDRFVVDLQNETGRTFALIEFARQQ